MIKINNYNEILEELTDIFMGFDKDCNTYQTDVYFYYDHKSKMASISTFVNVGGNSWLDDDHYTIYTDKEHYDDGMWSYYNNADTAEIASVLSITEDSLCKEIKAYYEYEDDDELTPREIEKYIETERGDYLKILTDEYNSYFEDNRYEYSQKAENILEDEVLDKFVYFSNDETQIPLISMIEGSNKDLAKLNNYVASYDEKHGGLELDDIKEHLEDEGVIAYDFRYGLDMIMPKLDEIIKKESKEKTTPEKDG